MSFGRARSINRSFTAGVGTLTLLPNRACELARSPSPPPICGRDNFQTADEFEGEREDNGRKSEDSAKSAAEVTTPTRCYLGEPQDRSPHGGGAGGRCEKSDGGAGRASERASEEECRPRGSIPKSVQAPPPSAKSSTLAPRTRDARSLSLVAPRRRRRRSWTERLAAERRVVSTGSPRSRGSKRRSVLPLLLLLLLSSPRGCYSAARATAGGSLDLARDASHPLPPARCTFLSTPSRDTIQRTRAAGHRYRRSAESTRDALF